MKQPSIVATASHVILMKTKYRQGITRSCIIVKCTAGLIQRKCTKTSDQSLTQVHRKTDVVRCALAEDVVQTSAREITRHCARSAGDGETISGSLLD